MILQPWYLLFMALASWLNRQQQAVIEYLREENRVLGEKLGKQRILLRDGQRRRLIASKYDGSRKRGPGRPGMQQNIRQLILQMAKENLSWGKAPT